ncbi:conserved protein of unknown function [Tenacibaculum litopenaei]
MPFSDCSSTLLATGDTKEAIDQMALWAKKYKHHTQTLAQEVFSNLPLQQLCKELHSFLYNHFQYKIDGYKQKLRSPACSWSSRHQGIDCKSYSIFASTVLLNLGVSHSLRRVEQQAGKGYSHVYVIVTKDQKNFDLSKGYYVIDGTIIHNVSQEVNYTKKDDVFMSANASETLGASIVGALTNSAVKVISVITDLLIKGLLNELMGCGDAEFDAPVVQMKLKRDLLAPLNKMLTNLEHAISINNDVRIEHIFNNIFKELDLGIAHLENETAFSQRDECIAQTLASALKYVTEVKKVVDIYFINFKKSYPHLEVREFSRSAHVGERTLYFVVKNASNPIVAEYRFITVKSQKNSYPVSPIFPFKEEPNTWLSQNIHHLKNTYNDGREQGYKTEITPLLNKALALRAKYYLGGEMLYYSEQPIHDAMRQVWLKFDDKYLKFLTDRAKINYQANLQSLKAYQERFNKEVAENENAKKRKKNKMYAGIGLTAIALLLIASSNTEKEE